MIRADPKKPVIEEDDEGNICRVCRCPGTPDQPLFYPCLCSGSIKYIHQDCLTTWLEHSQKRYCELCNHPFAFSPIYEDNMPTALPLNVFVSGIMKRCSGMAGTWLRYIFVFAVWIFLFPYCTFQIWKFYFGHTSQDPILDIISSLAVGKPSEIMVSQSEMPLIRPWYHGDLYSWFLIFLWETFLGTIISSLIFLGFLSMTVFREFIVTNAILNEVQIPEQLEPNEGDEEESEVAEAEADELEAHGESNLHANLHPNFNDSRSSNNQTRFEDSLPYSFLEKPDLELKRPLSPPPIDISEDERTSDIATEGKGKAPISSHAVLGVNSGSGGPSVTAKKSIFTPGSGRSHQLYSNPASGSVYDGKAIHEWHLKSIAHKESSTATSALLPSPIVSSPSGNPVIRTANASPRSVSNVSIMDTMSEPNPLNLDPNPDYAWKGKGKAVLNYMEDPQMSLDDGPSGSAEQDEYIRNLRIQARQRSIIKRFQRRNSQYLENAANLNNPLTNIDIPASNQIANPPGNNAPIQMAMQAPPPPVVNNMNNNNNNPANEEAGNGGMFDLRVVFQNNQNAEELTFQEILGLKGPIRYLIQHLLTILIANSFILGSVVLIPALIGQFALTIPPFLWESMYPLAVEAFNLILKPWLTLVSVSLKNTLDVDFVQVGTKFAMKIYAFLESVREGSASAALLDSAIPIENSKIVIIKSYGNVNSSTTIANQMSENLLTHLMLGYLTIGLSLFLYIKIIDRYFLGNQYGTSSSANNPIKSVIEFLATFTKATFLLSIELLSFPLMCGCLLDICTLELFQSTITNRLIFTVNYPLASIIIHWLAGSLFMFQFAIFISYCRDILRPGLLFFIRNPNDPNYQPMREVVEKPLVYQLKRIAASAIVYSFIILMFFGLALKVFKLVAGKALYPLKFSFSDPISELPLDLITVNLILPFVFERLKPIRWIRTVTSLWFRLVTRFLRLSSYFYGGRYKYQETNGDGTFVFVPSFDHAYNNEERLKMTGKPVQEEDLARYGLIQSNPLEEGEVRGPPSRVNEHADIPDIAPRAQGDFHQIESRYTIVYRPSNFKVRIFGLLLLLWFSISTFTISFSLMPVILGRYMAKKMMVRELHDMYTFQLGFHTIWISLFLFVWKSMKLIYLTAVTFVLLPLLFGFFIDLLVTSVRSSESSYIFFPANDSPIRLAADRLRQDGLWNVDLYAMHRHILLPVFSALLGMIVGPYFTVKIVSFLLQLNSTMSHQLLLISFPIVFFLVPLYLFLNYIFEGFEKLLTTIRDDAYLIGKRLHNLERPDPLAVNNGVNHGSSGESPTAIIASS